MDYRPCCTTSGLQRHIRKWGDTPSRKNSNTGHLCGDTTVMGITGFMMWNPITATKYLPGEFVPAAKAAHGGEAVLAVLAILIWHMYGVQSNAPT